MLRNEATQVGRVSVTMGIGNSIEAKDDDCEEERLMQMSDVCIRQTRADQICEQNRHHTNQQIRVGQDQDLQGLI